MPELVRRRWGLGGRVAGVQMRAPSTAPSSRLAEASRHVTSGPPWSYIGEVLKRCKP